MVRQCSSLFFRLYVGISGVTKRLIWPASRPRPIYATQPGLWLIRLLQLSFIVEITWINLQSYKIVFLSLTGKKNAKTRKPVFCGILDTGWFVERATTQVNVVCCGLQKS